MPRPAGSVRAIVVAALTAGAMVGFAAAAAAAPAKVQPPNSGDNRATAHEGNVVQKHCPDLFPGSFGLAPEDLAHSDDGTYLDITGVGDGIEVVAVIVKGGPAYNKYPAANLGGLPWLDLHSPINASGKPAEISHWFACAVETRPTSSTPPPTTTGTTTTTTNTDTPPSSSTEEPPASSESPVTTTSQEVDLGAGGVDEADAEDGSGLADTGFDNGWLVALGAGLLLGGGALLLLMRARRAER